MAISNNTQSSASAKRSVQQPQARQTAQSQKSTGLDDVKNLEEAKKAKGLDKAAETALAQETQPVETIQASQEVQNATRNKVKATENVVKANRLHDPLAAEQTTAAGDAQSVKTAAALDGSQTLKNGSKGAKVNALQETLNALGSNLQADSKFGRKTQQAVKDFQKTQGLSQDGIAGPKTQKALQEAIGTQAQRQAATAQATAEVKNPVAAKMPAEGTPAAAEVNNAKNALSTSQTLKKGSKGSEVQALQESLNAVGGKLGEDGDFGNATKQAVRDFQRTQGLTPDGIAGHKTLKALNKAVGSKADVGLMTDLARGAKGAEVMAMQKMLKAEGGQITPDGIFGKKTEEAIKGFQAANDLPVDGIAGRATLQALKENTAASAQAQVREVPTLKAGMKGSDVENIQRQLIDQGAKIKADGVYGKGTAKAVRDFQRNNGLYQDGVAGPETQEALRNAQAPTGPFRPGTLTRGATGPEVKKLQEDLKAHGADIEPDGVFGVGTERAVRDFQTAAGLPPTGAVNPDTTKALAEQPNVRIQAAQAGAAQIGDLSAAELRKIVPTLSSAKAAKVVPFLNDAMREANINTPKRKAAFIAQVAHESAGFRYMEEIASGSAYEGRKDLGNTHKGDGRRFKGRGYMQVTGRYNYKAAGKALDLDLVNNPKLAARPENAARMAAWYWNSRGLNKYADKGQFKEITRRINGGYNGLADRQNYYRRALKALQ